MTDDRERLIDLITEKVMEEVRRGRAAAPAPPGPTSPPAPAAAPASAGSDAETQERMRLFSVSGARSPEETRTLHEAGAARVGATMGYCPASDGLASLIDHTMLKPDATREEIEQLCREALQFCFASVCVNPNWVPLCASLLKGGGVKVCTVIGFPFGDTNGSRHCVSASSPVLAVTSGGSEYVSSGSTIATVGSIDGLRRLTFTRASSTMSTALRVTSAPVPAVVGMAIVGTEGSASGRARPTTSRYSMSGSRLVISAATAFPASITLPPPIAIT